MKKTETAVYGLDTEDDGQGNPLLFAIVGSTGAWYCRDRTEFLARLLALCDGRRIEIWATNLEYDLVNVFGTEHLSRVEWRFARSYLVSARWNGIRFLDTLRHLPASVAELGDLVGLPKLDFDPTNADYCVRDAAITYRAAMLIRSVYAEFGVTPSGTMASTAYRIWKDTFWKREVVRPWDEILERVGPAYYGGRTECFWIGRVRGVRAIDVASMYPWAMVADSFPVPWGAASRTREIIPEGVYNVDVKVHRPCLPYRGRDGLCFPIGAWSGSYIGSELLEVLRTGGNVRVHHGIRWVESVRPFDGYVDALFARKQAARGPSRRLYKLMLNGLYGKFGQRGDRVRVMELGKFRRMRQRAPEDYRVWGDLVLWNEEGPIPPWGNRVWSAIVTARARLKLWRELERIREHGGTVVYCDTDSAVFSGADDLRYPESGPVGSWELRGQYDAIEVVAKKEYTIFDSGGPHFYTKGVPQSCSYDYLTTGYAAFDRPVKFREGIRSGETFNFWRRVEKKAHGRRSSGPVPCQTINA